MIKKNTLSFLVLILSAAILYTLPVTAAEKGVTETTVHVKTDPSDKEKDDSEKDDTDENLPDDTDESSYIDSAFASGTITFSEAEFSMPDPETCEIILPPESFLEKAGVGHLEPDDIRRLLPDASFAVLNYSPDGSHGVGALQIGDLLAPVVVSPDRIAAIYPSETRGVDDEDGILWQVYSRTYLQANTRMPFGLGDTGAIWSPGGRYFCILNSTAALVYAKTEYCCPVMIDSLTGEMFLMDSFSLKLTDDNAGVWTTGCFSEDEKYFYAMYYGRKYENRGMLLCYDLETFEAEVIGDGFENNVVPSCTLLQGGKIFALIDGMIPRENQCLISMDPDTMDTEQCELAPGSDLWRFYARRVYCSEQTGQALISGSVLRSSDNQELAYGLIRVDPEESLSDGLDTIWMIDKETLQPVSLTSDQVTDLFDSERSLYYELTNKYLVIFDMTLSPDGKYAAVLAGKAQLDNDEIVELLIVRLADMASVKAEGTRHGGFTDLLISSNQCKGGNYLLNWSDAGLIYTKGTGLYTVK